MSMGVRIRDLVVSGDKGRRLLEIPSLEIESGGSLGIRGASGAGKSTLLFAMAGLLDHLHGEVVWGETDIAGLSPRARATFRRSHIGIVFQDFQLFDELGALANASVSALYSPRSQRTALRERADRLLSRVGVSTGDRRISSLSGGEKQRVAVARALAGDAGVLLADEPTANLDRDAADKLSDALTHGAARAGRTLVVVSHDPTLLAKMDRVITLQDGLMTHPARRAA